MNKPIPVVVHTNNEEMFFAMMNAQSKVHMAVEQKNKAEEERDLAVFRLCSAIEDMRQKEAKRIQRNLFILKVVVFGLSAVGCVASAVACIRSGLWYAAFAPFALIVTSAFNLKK